MSTNLISNLLNEEFTSNTLTMEGISLEKYDDQKYIYVVLTDTKTFFSKLSKKITKDPYNHVSIAFDDDLERLYTYAITTDTNKFGGFKVERRKDLKGARYSLYAVTVDSDVYNKLYFRIIEELDNKRSSAYNFKGLVNLVIGKEIFGTDNESMYCSQFVVRLLEDVGVVLFTKKETRDIAPYDLVRSKLLRFIRRGKL